MASEGRSLRSLPDPKSRSLFDLPSDFFNFSRLFYDGAKEMADTHFSVPPKASEISANGEDDNLNQEDKEEKERGRKVISRLSCNTCKDEFDSLHDQRSHFKSDIHRFNVKLSVAGKDTIKEQDFDELTSDSLSKDYDVSSISGSEDETEESCSNPVIMGKGVDRVKLKLFIRLQGGDIVSIWKCLLLNELEDISFEKNKSSPMERGGHCVGLSENDLLERLKYLIHEPRDKTCLRIVLLASGGHFAGCVFDGTSVVAQKTFHRYVVRAKTGNRQMTKDATGKAAKSAGASLRRYNEIALKKEIQELLVAWKPYFDASACIFIYAPSINRQLLFDGENPSFSRQNCAVRHVPLTVRRPTLKEAKRVYNQLTFMAYVLDEKGSPPSITEDSLAINVGKSNQEESKEEELSNPLENKESSSEGCSDLATSSGLSVSNKSEVIGTADTAVCSIELTTPLHEAARSSDAQLTLELLEQGMDPCVKDARGRTPYMVATEKEVRNTFRRFMALNLDKWDWHAANVPSPLTKEMEDSQAAKQAEKDAKRKAKSKELKKLRKAKEKAQAQAPAPAPLPQNASAVSQKQNVLPVPIVPGNLNSIRSPQMSKEEELKRSQAAEREKRAVAAERRIAAFKGLGTSTTAGPSSSDPKSGGSDINCSCCMASLAGKVPFHRYHYKYCSTSCMHVHREMLEDG